MSDERVVSGHGRQTRRAMLAGAGVIGASVVLAGCGTDTTDGPGVGAPPVTSDTPAGAAATGGADGGAAALAKASEVPVGGGVIVDKIVVTQPKQGEFKAFSAVCPHQGCTVSGVSNGTIICGCHNSKFSIEDGSVQGGPANKPLAEKQIKQDGDTIVLA